MRVKFQEAQIIQKRYLTNEIGFYLLKYKSVVAFNFEITEINIFTYCKYHWNKYLLQYHWNKYYVIFLYYACNFKGMQLLDKTLGNLRPVSLGRIFLGIISVTQILHTKILLQL